MIEKEIAPFVPTPRLLLLAHAAAAAAAAADAIYPANLSTPTPSLFIFGESEKRELRL